MDSHSHHIERSFELAEQLRVLADEGEAQCRDDGCLLLYSVIRDSAYRIMDQARRERNVHRAQGDWDGGTEEEAGPLHSDGRASSLWAT